MITHYSIRTDAFRLALNQKGDKITLKASGECEPSELLQELEALQEAMDDFICEEYDYNE